MNGVTRRATFGAAASITVGALAGCTSRGSSLAIPGQQVAIGSAAMEPTLMQGTSATFDPVAAGKYRPRRQDIVLFHPPAAWRGFDPKEVFVSRVIGIAGDTVACDGEDGSPVWLNNVQLKEPYLYPGDSPSRVQFVAKVPAGRLFLLDDHRSIGLDCRYQVSDANGSGYVPVGNVGGIYHP